MRSVLLIGNFLSAHGGSRGVCEELAERLASAGWSVLRTSSRGSRVLRLADMMGTAWRRRGDYAVAQVDVFSGPAFFWAEASCWVLRRAGRPYVLTLHGGNLPAFAARWPRRVRRLLGSARSVTVPSPYLLEQMRPYCARLSLLANAIDLDAYRFRIRKQPRPRLVWLRAFHNVYCPGLAVHVVARLTSRFPDIELLMAGPDKQDGSRQQVERLANELGVLDRIRLSGQVQKKEVPAWLNQGDVFLNTTTIDNTPVSVLEAMACGLCVVSTRVGGTPYLLDEDRDAILVSPNDPAAMAEAVERVMTEDCLAERLSRNARAKAEQYDWKVVMPQWESMLSRPTAAQTSPRPLVGEG